MRFSDQIRDIVAGSIDNRSSFCRSSYLDYSIIRRFMAGERGLSQQSLDRLGIALQLRIVPLGSRKGVMKDEPLSRQIRLAVKNSGLDRPSLCKFLGRHEASMSRFLAGKTCYRIDILDRLLDRLGMEVVSDLPRLHDPSQKGA